MLNDYANLKQSLAQFAQMHSVVGIGTAEALQKLHPFAFRSRPLTTRYIDIIGAL